MQEQKKETCKTLQIPINQRNKDTEYSADSTDVLGLIIRIGSVYNKQVYKVDKFGNLSSSLVQTTRQTIIDDHGKDAIYKVKKYDGYCNVPDNLNVRTEIGGNYNLYQKLNHTPIKGAFKTISTLLKHIFGDQLEIGLDYLQLLYTNPTQILPVLCLVSAENSTGKTTFANLLSMIFGSNTVVLGKGELETQFNGVYASKLCIVFDESKVEPKYMDKLKSLATAQTIQLRLMRTDHQAIDFFGKIILLSNHTKDFISATKHDIRFWVRSLKPLDSFDPDFDNKLKNEIPAFLYYLQNRKLSTTKQSRMWFTPDQIATKDLLEVQKNSKSWLCKEIEENVMELLETVNEVQASPKDLKTFFFNSDNRIGISNIKKVLIDELGLKVSKATRYTFPFGASNKTGRPYLFTKETFETV
ncbi:MAG: hypothetical protein JEZ01_08360 [Labilibaculum sp.]|nr:primase-helicase family protein [Labilibaculum sp.]MBI9057774.1 hypothetical protein [Labilibaculum sp.]